ncbi:MAG: hypothetical protein GAK45_01688 [Pseudomonas citronellolis]|nr:MAG: hypothetical protein GAK45_01688 [Pseudomonas citronellolis]
MGTRHAGITHTQLHDGAFLLTDAVQRIAHTGNQCVELLGYQLDRHEQLGQDEHFGLGLFALATVLLQGFLGLFQLLGDGAETTGGFFRVRTTIAFVIAVGVALFLFFVLFLGLAIVFEANRFDFFRRQAAVVGVDIATEDIGQATAFSDDAAVIRKDAVNRTRELGDGAHDFADAFLDALGDFDLAFAGQQFHGPHFTHVHAHRVGGAANVAFDRSQGGGGFFGGSFIGIGFGQQKGVRIRGCLEYVDPHVVDHADDVFYLFRIRDILRQVVVDLRVSQVALLTTAGDQLFETRLLLRFSGHNTLSTEGLGGQKQADHYSLEMTSSAR